MAIKTFTTGEVLTAADTNTYLNNGGLVWIAEQIITTSTATVEFVNCFTSTYANYRLVISNVLCINQGDIRMYFGTTLGATGYYGSCFYDRSDGGLTGYVRSNNIGTVSIGLSDNAAGSISSYSVDIFEPQRGTRTMMAGNYQGRVSYTGFSGGCEASNTQFTTLRLFNSVGNISQGSFRLYGYRQA